MAVMFDWDGYRQEAGRQTAALNHAPGVADPAALTNDPAVNQEYLYGKDNQNNLMPGVYAEGALDMFKAKVQEMLGRPATDAEIKGFAARFASEGGSSRTQAQQIANEVKSAQEASQAADQNVQNGTATQPYGFGGGIMAYPQGTFPGFGGGLMGGGLMGGNVLGGGFAGYRDPFTASN